MIRTIKRTLFTLLIVYFIAKIFGFGIDFSVIFTDVYGWYNSLMEWHKLLLFSGLFLSIYWKGYIYNNQDTIEDTIEGIMFSLMVFVIMLGIIIIWNNFFNLYPSS